MAERSGDAGNNTLIGTSSNDILWGRAGNDTLEGGAGRDFLNGGVGADVLRGGEGADALVGSYGNDTLEGGAGYDVACYEVKGNIKFTKLEGGVIRVDSAYEGTDFLQGVEAVNLGGKHVDLATMFTNRDTVGGKFFDGRADGVVTLVGQGNFGTDTSLSPADLGIIA